MTLGHGVWLNAEDIDIVAQTGTCICHNCSSNFRLRSGLAPLNAWEKKGITVGMGLDEAGINDDRDMLQELRLALRVHRVPGMDDDDVPTPSQVVKMATESGAMTTAFGAEIGRLDPGRFFDASLIDWRRATYPFQDPDIPVLDALVQRAKTECVDAVYIDGELVYAEGRFTRIDRDAVLAEIADVLGRPRSPEEVARRELGRAVFPHVKAFYADYLPAAPATRSTPARRCDKGILQRRRHRLAESRERQGHGACPVAARSRKGSGSRARSRRLACVSIA